MGAVAVTAPPASLRRTHRTRGDFDGYRSVQATLTLSSSYATGGDTLSPAAVGLSRVYKVLIEADDAKLAAGQKNPFTLTADVSVPTAPKIKCYDAANTEEGAGTNRADTSVVAFIVGV